MGTHMEQVILYDGQAVKQCWFHLIYCFDSPLRENRWKCLIDRPLVFKSYIHILNKYRWIRAITRKKCANKIQIFQ